MPPVIAAAVTAAGITGSIGGVSIASLIGEGVTLGGIFALGQLTQPRTHQPAGQFQLTKQAVPPRVRVYGRVMMGGALYFQAAPYIYQRGTYFCDGPIDAFEDIYLGDYLTVGIPTGIAGDYPWLDWITFETQTGTIPQSRPASLNYPWWDATHEGNGLANIVMNCLIPYDPTGGKNLEQMFKTVYPSGVPALRAVLRGSKIYDPRDVTQSWTDPTTWKWSQNSALCILDFLTSNRGYNIPNARIDLASFTAFAYLCDSTVLRYDGTTELAYVCWGSYRLDEEPRSVLERLLLTCDGELLQQSDGTIGIRGGQFVTPSVTITSDMILGYEVQNGPDKMSAFNEYRIHFTSPLQGYQLIEGNPYDDVVAQAANGGQIIAQDLELAFVPSDWQAYRLAKIYMAQNNPEWLLTLTTTIAALDALGERFVNVEIDELGISDSFLIKKFDISGDLRTCTLTLASLHADTYNVMPSVDFGVWEYVAPSTPVTIPNVTGLSDDHQHVSIGLDRQPTAGNRHRARRSKLRARCANQRGRRRDLDGYDGERLLFGHLYDPGRRPDV
ncbi:MAG TPA: hypothetical protein VL996_01640 [Methylocella sp.]|nr:hypothetical protein [Methylocella sp.]